MANGYSNQEDLSHNWNSSAVDPRRRLYHEMPIPPHYHTYYDGYSYLMEVQQTQRVLMRAPPNFHHDQAMHDYNDIEPIPITDAEIYEEPSRQDEFENLEGSLIPLAEINNADVLCGRGAGSNIHSGNITFRSLIGQYQQSYLIANAVGKAEIAKGIVAEIKQHGGRFLKRSADAKGLNGNANILFDIGDKAAREKTCQALRERGPSVFDAPLAYKEETLAYLSNEEVVPARPLMASISFYGVVVVNDNDILLGRGGVTNSHAGNKNYRALVRQNQKAYLAAPKLDKAKIALAIVKEVLSRGGRFLCEKGSDWVEVTQEKAREKTSQALREKAPELRRIFDSADRSGIDQNQTQSGAKKRKERTQSAEVPYAYPLQVPTNFHVLAGVNKKQRVS